MSSNSPLSFYLEVDNDEFLLPAKKQKTTFVVCLYGTMVIIFMVEMMVPCFEVITWNFTDHHFAQCLPQCICKSESKQVGSKLIDGKFTLATGRTQEYDKFYVYQHARHAVFSNVTFTLIATFASITEMDGIRPL